MVEHITGLIAAPLSPLSPNGTVNLQVIKRYAEFLHTNGVVGAFVNGTTGEGLSLTAEERKAIAAQWAQDSPKGFKVIIHVGHTSLEDSIALARHAQEIGAAAIATIGPIWFKPRSVDELVDHSATIAAAAPKLPFYYYHIPSLTGLNFNMREYLRAADAKIPNLAGIKYTFENMMDMEMCRLFKNGNYDILMGRDEMLLCALVLGAKGGVGSTYNYAAPLYNTIIQAYNAGDIPKAQIWQRKSMEMIDCILDFKEFFAASKAILRMEGIDLGPVRSPLKNLSPAEEQALQAALMKIGFSGYQSK
jgi:N-acetylneuraminate lyase